MTAVLQAPPWAETQPPLRVPHRTLAVLAVLGTLLGLWSALGHSARLEEGGLFVQGGLRPASDGLRTTRYVALPSGADAVLTVRNAGHLPVTLAAPRYDDTFSPVQVRGLQTVDLRSRDVQPRGPVLRQLRLAPGQTAALRVHVGLEPCLPWAEGSVSDTTEVLLRARTLGIWSDARSSLDTPLTVAYQAPC